MSSVRDLFNTDAPVCKSKFIVLPNLGKYMRFPRYVLLLKNITFMAPIPCSQRDSNSFWKVQPFLVDAFNDNRVRTIFPGGKLVVDESMSGWRDNDSRFGACM